MRATWVRLWRGAVGLGAGALLLTAAGSAAAQPGAAGAQLRPFICQTQSFLLPDGSNLGPPLDAACGFTPRIDYVYMPKAGGGFRPMADTARLPDDVATTTTTAGLTVPFVVRLETTPINRGIHQNAVLFDPTAETAPTPAGPPRAWNRRLLAVHGVGCPGGWYIQGAAQGVSVLDPVRLGEGYAVFNNTLRHPTNSCNAALAGETAKLDKAHVVEVFGAPDFTVSMGGSGGAYTSLQIADAFPGLFDGLLISATFPDALSIAMAGSDAHLLSHYFAGPGAGFSEAQRVAVSGYKSLRAFADAAGQVQRTDPVSDRTSPDGYRGAVWNPAVPATLRYDPKTNPHGARPTIFDVARDIYGVDRATGFALRPFDNVGVQYGQMALRARQITPAQFLDLNARIGGYDRDANFVTARSVGDLGAIRRAQEAGLALGGGGGLASIPVLDAAGGPLLYDEDGGYHYQWFHFAVRERMKQANGDASNHVMWRGGIGMADISRTASAAALSPEGQAVSAKVTVEGWNALVDWIAAIKADPGAGSTREKVRRDRPANLMDGCWTKSLDPQFIAEPQTWGRGPDTRCNALYPSYSFVRKEAGGPLAANVYKCQLKAIDPKDYAGFTATELARLRAIFPTGVCDFTRPGQGAARVIPRT